MQTIRPIPKAFTHKKAPPLRLGELFIKEGFIQKADLKIALEVQRGIKNGHRIIGKILCDLRLITLNDLNYILQKYDNQLQPGDILIKQDFSSEGRSQKATQDQPNTHKKPGRTLLDQKAITADQLFTALSMIELNIKEEKQQEEAAKTDDMMSEQVVNYIIRLGINEGASDIHIEQDREGTRLRYRTDGICKEVEIEWLNEKLKKISNAIISRIKVLAGLDIAERHLPQDGVFRVNYYDAQQDRRYDLDFRVATCPAIVGENVTLRILDSRKEKMGLDHLNHSPHILTPLKRLCKSAAGMVLVSGPTGSGKSSTLYAVLRYIYHPGIKIITAEDAIEYCFPGIMQTRIKPNIGLTSVRLLRSFLRMDPDVILLGEISDKETAGIAFDAAQTGHLMLSTVHTDDAVSAVSRLLDLDIDYSRIASSLIGVLAQRLVRKTCTQCKLKYTPPEDEWHLFFNTYPKHLTFYKGMGCKACGYSGYKGKTLISELFEINRDVALALSRGINKTQLKRMALEGGMKTLIDDGLLKLDHITLAEIIRVVPIEMIKEFASRDTNESEDSPSPLKIMPPSFSEQINIELGHPEKETTTIKRLFERYQIMRNSAGRPDLLADPDTFRQYIDKTFKQITEKYGCQQVRFEFAAKNSKITITATPVEETPS